MTEKHKNLIITILMLVGVTVMIVSCSNDTALTEKEAAAITGICGLDASGFSDISRDVLVKEITAKFPAVVKAYRHGNLYAFIVKPVAYNGPVTMALVIDRENDCSIGLRIIEHNETQHYVRDMESSWFTGRFTAKTALKYLSLTRLEPHNEFDIVAITGATVTTEGVINGVNAAFGVYQEAVLGKTADDVPYMVRFEPGQGDGPVESGKLAVRAYGVVIGEISLEEIRALPSVRRTLSIHSTGGVTQHCFRGTLLSNVLDLAEPGIIEDYSWVLAIGVDDYISGIKMEEVRAENNVFVMYEDNDEPLQKKNGEPGAMRVVVINDVFGQRFTNYLLEIVLEGDDE